MIHAQEIWDIIQKNMPRERWISLEEIYHLIKSNWNLDADNFEWQSSTSDIPKWKRNVRNVLQHKKRIGKILWNGEAKYLLN
jgi:hypothetical protein